MRDDLFDSPLYFQRFSPGSVVSGRFEIVRQIGAGGMGEVYEARDRVMGRNVALKAILEDFGADPLMETRFLDEVRIGLTVTHPNLVRLYDVGFDPSPQDPETVFLTMELLRGKTLADRIAEGPVPEAECERYGREMVSGISALHEQGIVHRDLKSNNVFLTDGMGGGWQRAVIMDFGLARNLLPSRPDDDSGLRLDGGQSFGAPEYVAPEVLAGSPATEKSDIYSLGVMLYEMLTGERPRHGSKSLKPSLFNPGLTRDWDRACLACLSGTAGERPARVENILEIISQDRKRKSRKAILRKSAAVTAIGLVALGVMAAGTFLHAQSFRPGGEARRWYDLGVSAMQDANYFRAMQDFEMAGNQTPSFALAHARRADAAFELEYFGIANSEILKATAGFWEQLSLTSSERGYIEAIEQELRHNFKLTSNIYASLAGRSKGTSRLEALLALSRAYEKNKRIGDALGTARVARAEFPDSPPAALRLGVLLGSHRQPEAEAILKEAERLYKREGNIEGQSEAILRRATVVNGGDRPAEAQALLNSVIQLTPRSENEFQHVKAMLQLSRLSSSLDHPAEGERLAYEAIRIAEVNDIEGLAASARTDLGNAELVRGDLPHAIGDFQASREAAMHWGVYRVEERANFGLAQALIYQGMDQNAVSNARAALDYWKGMEERASEASALAVITEAYCDLEEPVRAREAADAGLELAKAYGKPEILGLAYESEGTVDASFEHYADALKAFELAEAQYTDTSMLAWNAKFRGDVLWRLGRYQDAEKALQQAGEVALRTGDAQLAAEVDEVRCEMELSRQQLDLARRWAERAIHVNGVSRPVRTWELQLLLAQSESGLGAETRARSSLAAIQNTQNRRVLRLANLVLGGILLKEKHTQQARDFLSEAALPLGTPDLLETHWKSSELIRQSDGADAMANSMDWLQWKSSWPAGKLGDYLKRPDIRELTRSYHLE